MWSAHILNFELIPYMLNLEILKLHMLNFANRDGGQSQWTLHVHAVTVNEYYS